MTGKEKCNLLRQIRREIAEANGIIYLTKECDYKGDDCPGTCPICDAEVRYLDYQLNLMASHGKPISVAGISLNTYRNTVSTAEEIHPDWITPPPTTGQMAVPETGGFLPNNEPLGPGIMAAPDPNLKKDIRTLNLPTMFVWWLRRERVHTVEQLRDMMRFSAMTIRRENEGWYELAKQKLRELDIYV